MHRNRTWLLDPIELRTQRNRILPIEGGDGSTLTLDFTTGVLDPRLTFTRDGGGTYVANDGYIYGMDFATSSSLAIGTGSKSVTLTATAGVDRRYLVGQTVWISNGTNNMRGPVTAYNASTQVLTINAANTSGSGSFTSWTVGNASARFDHDPTTGSPRGLLIESGATNLALRSNDFNTTVTDGSQWTASGYTATATSTTLPDGTTGNTLRISIASGSGSVRSASITVSPSTTYTWSFWARNNGGSQARFRVWNATAGTSIVDYTLPGSNYVSQIGGANNTSTTWVRVSVTFTTPVGCTSIFVYPTSSDSGTVDMFVWGAQVESGSGASSYIPTVTSTGTRNADNCELLDLTTMGFNANTGTIYTDVGVRRNTGSQRNYTFLPASGANNQIFEGSGVALNVYTSGSFVAQIGTSGLSASKIAAAYAASDYAVSVNGGTVATVTAGNVPTSLTKLTIGGSIVNATAYANGCIRVFKYWPTRLPNAQLQSITT